jgi:hypothetical protein
MSLGSTELLTEMSARNPPEGMGRLDRKTDNVATICKPIVQDSGIQPFLFAYSQM